jgi:hypothetical protein
VAYAALSGYHLRKWFHQACITSRTLLAPPGPPTRPNFVAIRMTPLACHCTSGNSFIIPFSASNNRLEIPTSQGRIPSKPSFGLSTAIITVPIPTSHAEEYMAITAFAKHHWPRSMSMLLDGNANEVTRLLMCCIEPGMCRISFGSLCIPCEEIPGGSGFKRGDPKLKGTYARGAGMI